MGLIREPKNVDFTVQSKPWTEEELTDFRKMAGYTEGKLNAKAIIDNLERNKDGEITETVKFVTSSMGTAYHRGFSQAHVDYVKEANAAIVKFNEGIDIQKADLYAKAVKGEIKVDYYLKQVAALEGLKKKEISIKIEWVMDWDSHQEDQADPNAATNYYMRSNDNSLEPAEDFFVDRKHIQNGRQTGFRSDGSGESNMSGHHPANADHTQFPTPTSYCGKPDKRTHKENPRQ